MTGRLKNIYSLLIRDQELRETRDLWKMAQYLFTLIEENSSEFF